VFDEVSDMQGDRSEHAEVQKVRESLLSHVRVEGRRAVSEGQRGEQMPVLLEVGLQRNIMDPYVKTQFSKRVSNGV